MTRKDYELIASAIQREMRDASSKAEAQGISFAAHGIASKLKQDNARFDRARFLRACGVTA